MALLSVGCNKWGRAAGWALFLLVMIAPRPAPAADVTVIMDQAKLMRLPDRVATIVIGNPMIADASLQPGGLMVITGKGYGLTNLMVLDRAVSSGKPTAALRFANGRSRLATAMSISTRR